MRGSCEQRSIKTATSEATHLDADGAPIESTRVRSIVGEGDHLSCLIPVLANHIVCRNARLGRFEPLNRALVTTLAIVQH
jgi:hypothetical protein